MTSVIAIITTSQRHPNRTRPEEITTGTGGSHRMYTAKWPIDLMPSTAACTLQHFQVQQNTNVAYLCDVFFIFLTQTKQVLYFRLASARVLWYLTALPSKSHKRGYQLEVRGRSVINVKVFHEGHNAYKQLGRRHMN